MNESKNIKKIRSERRTRRYKKKFYLKIAGLFLIFAGVGLLIYPLLTNLYASYEQKELRQKWEEDPVIHVNATETEVATTDTTQHQETTAQVQPQKPPTSIRIIIPKIELDTMVVEGTDKADLKKGPGHMKGTAYPGENGTCVISGHRITYGAPFNQIDKLVTGDVIILETPENKYTYRVKELKVVKPTDTWVIKPTSTPTLVLTTCHPPRSARQRLVVFADLVN